MTWLIIIAILAAAFAPIAYMMPSKRDKYLSNLRMIARREGLEVDVTRLPKLDAEPHERVSAGGVAREALAECVSYGIRLPKSDGPTLRYRLLHTPDAQWPVLPDSAWQLDDGFTAAGVDQPRVGDSYWDILAVLEPLLPQDRLGLAINGDFALFYWRERLAEEGIEPAEAIANIRRMLNKIVKHHQESFPSNTPPQSPESPG